MKFKVGEYYEITEDMQGHAVCHKRGSVFKVMESTSEIDRFVIRFIDGEKTTGPWYDGMSCYKHRPELKKGDQVKEELDNLLA